MCSRLRTNRPRTCSSGASGDYGASVTGVPYIYIPITDRCSSGQVKEQRKTAYRSSRAYPSCRVPASECIRYIVLYIMLCVCAYYYCIRRVHLNTCMTYNNNKKKKYVCIFNGYKLVL